ncbi:MAG TPA: hypothetical protein VFC19_19775, partial [Candidatus Limnocylindrales bacterium]|nr:hypothetical protein [Candidatus Limnocylindrales bacterium]
MISDVLAHGVGGRQDLPIPFEYALAGALVALVATFIILTRSWPRSKFRGAAAGRPLPSRLASAMDARPTRVVLRVLGLGLFAWIVAELLFGDRLGRDNAAPGMLYVWIWVGVPLLSMLFGPVWRLISPMRTIHAGLSRLVGQNPSQGMRVMPQRWGLWPGAAALLVFVWLELVPESRGDVPIVGMAVAVYAAYALLGGLMFGDEWFARADPFEVYSTLASRLSPLGRRDDGKLVLRNPFDGLDATPIVPGLAAVVVVLLGSTAFDSLSSAPQWVSLTQESGSKVLWGTLGLLGWVVVVGACYVVCSRKPGQFAHSIVPIALGYVVAHYYSLIILEGQRTFILATRGGENTGLAVLDMTLVYPAFVAALQVIAVVAGHITGAVAAHDRATRVYPPGK